jgi:hypothetical protein
MPIRYLLLALCVFTLLCSCKKCELDDIEGTTDDTSDSTQVVQDTTALNQYVSIKTLTCNYDNQVDSVLVTMPDLESLRIDSPFQLYHEVEDGDTISFNSRLSHVQYHPTSNTYELHLSDSGIQVLIVQNHHNTKFLILMHNKDMADCITRAHMLTLK